MYLDLSLQKKLLEGLGDDQPPKSLEDILHAVENAVLYPAPRYPKTFGAWELFRDPNGVYYYYNNRDGSVMNAREFMRKFINNQNLPGLGKDGENTRRIFEQISDATRRISRGGETPWYEKFDQLSVTQLILIGGGAYFVYKIAELYRRR